MAMYIKGEKIQSLKKKKKNLGVFMISSHRCNSCNPTDFIDWQLWPE